MTMRRRFRPVAIELAESKAYQLLTSATDEPNEEHTNRTVHI
jgi:hypothetical protein